MGFSALEDDWLAAEHFGGEEKGVLKLDEGAEGAVVVFNEVVLTNLPNIRMNS